MSNRDISLVYQLDKLVDKTTERYKKASLEAKGTVIKQMIVDTDPLVPFKTGKLAHNVKPLPGNIGYVYSQPYASFAFDPIAPSGSYKNYTKTVHPEAMGNSAYMNAERNGDKYAKLYADEVVRLAKE